MCAMWNGGQASIYSATFNLANTILGLGAGLLAPLPAAFSAWGMVMSVIGLLAAALFAIFVRVVKPSAPHGTPLLCTTTYNIIVRPA